MNKLEELTARLNEISDLQAIQSLLRWDQQVYMPPGGAQARAEQRSTLARIAHEKLVCDEMGHLLDDLEAELSGLDFDSYEASLVRVTRRRYDRERKLSADLVARLARARALGRMAWEKAREASDFRAFQPNLEQILDLTIEAA